MKQNPGEWLRDLLRNRLIDVGLLAMIGTGWLCGAGLALWVVFGVRLFSEPMNWIALLPGAGFLAAGLFKAKRGWRLSDMRKGANAEETIGQAIEFALTRDACAVAHNVKEIAKVGDIDHLVATPHGVWVIESKHGRVPESIFPETLRRIARNVEGVREWTPGTRVTGCLVFASELETPPKSTFKWGGETIRAFASAAALKRALRAEVRGTGSDSDLAQRVWKLGKIEPTDQSVAAG